MRTDGEEKEMRLMGTGARSKVYSDGRFAWKVYGKGVEKSAVFYEALVHSLAERAGVPTAKIYGVYETKGVFSVKMDCLGGKPLNDLIVASPSETEFYLGKMLSLQAEIQAKKIWLPLNLKSRLREKIENGSLLPKAEMRGVLKLLEEMPCGDSLCHGDFHGYNILVEDGRYTVVDWADAATGVGEADICRTYMLYFFRAPKIADKYLDLYCGRENKSRSEILRWLPVVGAARLGEGQAGERRFIEEWIGSFLSCGKVF